MYDIFFWWSVFSTVLGLFFLGANVAQFVVSLKEKEIHKAQVKVWQHHANGIQYGLFVATLGKYSTVEDLRESVKAVHQSAAALFTSLNEERLFSEKEIKEQQMAKQKADQERQEFAEAQSRLSGS